MKKKEEDGKDKLFLEEDLHYANFFQVLLLT